MTGIKRIEKNTYEEIRARASVTNISQKISEAKLIWLGHVERKTGRCSNENMEGGSEWTVEDRKTKTTEVVRCYTKRHEIDRSRERSKYQRNQRIKKSIN